MSSYIYMKILESHPRRYDRGITILSFGQSLRATKRLVTDNVHRGSRVLDLGCGTGTAAILAARVGARVTGFDISAPLLVVAREKIGCFFRQVLLIGQSLRAVPGLICTPIAILE